MGRKEIMAETKLVKTNETGVVKISQARSRMKNALMFLPNLVKLCGKLITDSRVPAAEKALFAGAIVYAIMPLDIIPDFLPFVGQLDDTYLIALTLMRLISRTDESIVRQHWSGGGDIIKLLDSVTSLAPMLLPKRVTRVLSSEIKFAPNAEKILDLQKSKKPLVMEIPADEQKKNRSK